MTPWSEAATWLPDPPSRAIGRRGSLATRRENSAKTKENAPSGRQIGQKANTVEIIVTGPAEVDNPSTFVWGPSWPATTSASAPSSLSLEGAHAPQMDPQTEEPQ